MDKLKMFDAKIKADFIREGLLQYAQENGDSLANMANRAYNNSDAYNSTREDLRKYVNALNYLSCEVLDRILPSEEDFQEDDVFVLNPAYREDEKIIDDKKQ